MYLDQQQFTQILKYFQVYLNSSKCHFYYFRHVDTGSEYLQAHAKYLERDFKEKSMHEIFTLVNKAMEVSLSSFHLYVKTNHLSESEFSVTLNIVYVRSQKVCKIKIKKMPLINCDGGLLRASTWFSTQLT